MLSFQTIDAIGVVFSLILIAIYISIIMITVTIAHDKGLNPVAWGFLSLFLGMIALAIVCAATNQKILMEIHSTNGNGNSSIYEKPKLLAESKNASGNYSLLIKRLFFDSNLADVRLFVFNANEELIFEKLISIKTKRDLSPENITDIRWFNDKIEIDIQVKKKGNPVTHTFFF